MSYPPFKCLCFWSPLRLFLAGSGPPICAPQHDLNDRIVVEGDLKFRREPKTNGIVRRMMDYQITPSG